MGVGALVVLVGAVVVVVGVLAQGASALMLGALGVAGAVEVGGAALGGAALGGVDALAVAIGSPDCVCVVLGVTELETSAADCVFAAAAAQSSFVGVVVAGVSGSSVAQAEEQQIAAIEQKYVIFTGTPMNSLRLQPETELDSQGV